MNRSADVRPREARLGRPGPGITSTTLGALGSAATLVTEARRPSTITVKKDPLAISLLGKTY